MTPETRVLLTEIETRTQEWIDALDQLPAQGQPVDNIVYDLMAALSHARERASALAIDLALKTQRELSRDAMAREGGTR